MWDEAQSVEENFTAEVDPRALPIILQVRLGPPTFISLCWQKDKETSHLNYDGFFNAEKD